ncbi:MAG: ribbon-helix-helix protein, CopG family [Verrucomicrobia bacterium]|nr:ribbon-helix-helix protein, CopG family [Verrucomicrobiota bacterium]
MSSIAKVAVSLDQALLRKVDELVRARGFESRSEVIRTAIEEKIRKMDRRRLARECAKLVPKFERALAEEGLAEEAAAWPEY